MRRMDSVSKIWTRDPPHRETYKRLPSGDRTHVYGSASTVTVWSTLPLSRSIEETVCLKTRVTYSRLPSALTASPPAKDIAPAPGSANDRARVKTPSANLNSWTLFCSAPPEYKRVPSGCQTSPYHACSTIIVLLTVQLATSTTVSDGRPMPLFVTTR